MDDPVLSARGLCKSFGALAAIKDVSLALRPGEIHAIIGPNGAGKSTLIAMLCGTLTADSGAVHVAGRDVTQAPARARAQAGLARTFQISELALEDSVLQNVLLGALGAAARPWRFWRAILRDQSLIASAYAAIDRVGLAGFETIRAGELSHGQRRQLEVAVALTLRPKAFVMDEPMAGLGAEGSKELTALLDTLRREAPILLVEHDMDAVFALADRITVLVYGQVIATGTVAEIRANPAVQEAYLGSAA